MKINRTIARAIAGQVIDKVSKISTQEQDRLRKEITKSTEANELNLISKKITALENRTRILEDKLRKKYPNVHINWSSDYLRVNFSSRSQLKAESIANDVILANQLQGIEIPNLLEYVSKKYLNGNL